jgi:hypothetical protein
MPWQMGTNWWNGRTNPCLVKWNNQPQPTLCSEALVPIVDVSTGLARFLKVLITQTDICKHTIVSAIAF